MVIRLALVGKDIAHSGSPALYQKLLPFPLAYDLVDIKSRRGLPSLAELSRTYRGVNVTSPYKADYFSQARVDSFCQRLGAINCIAFRPGGFLATNTDYFAIRDIFYQLQSQREIREIFILGDGQMSKITQFFFRQNGIAHSIYSRKRGDDMAKMDFAPYPNALVINACSRGFVFSGQMSESSLFWDYNYSHSAQEVYFEQNGCDRLYQDGGELLAAQAKYAIHFWRFLP